MHLHCCQDVQQLPGQPSFIQVSTDQSALHIRLEGLMCEQLCPAMLLTSCIEMLENDQSSAQ